MGLTFTNNDLRVNLDPYCTTQLGVAAMLLHDNDLQLYSVTLHRFLMRNMWPIFLMLQIYIRLCLATRPFDRWQTAPQTQILLQS